MKRSLYIILLILNIAGLLIAGNYYIGIQLSYKYGTLGIITNNEITERERDARFDNYMNEQKTKGQISLVSILLLIILLIYLIKLIKKEPIKILPNKE